MNISLKMPVEQFLIYLQKYHWPMFVEFLLTILNIGPYMLKVS